MHRLAFQVLSTLSVCAAVTLAASAQAQTAQELHDQGISALTAGRHQDAVVAFDASYRAEATAPALYNLGLAYKGMERPDKALEAFEAFLKLAKPKKDATQIATAQSEVDRLKASFARFTLKLTPTDASIEIDNVRAQPENNELWVPIGNRSIKIRASGYETYQQRLDVAAGRFDLEINLRQPTTPPDQRATAMVDEAMVQHAAGALVAALDIYREAYALFPTPRGTAQMGLCEEQLGDLGAAETHVGEALKARRDSWIKQKGKDLRAALKRIQKQAGTLSITGTPDGAEVLINDRVVGTLPLLTTVRVPSGTWRVKARKKGYLEVEQAVDISARGSRTVAVSLTEAPPAEVVPMPFPVPEPVAPLPEAVAALPPPPSAPTQADIEAETQARQELPSEPDDARSLATGFEMALNFGYQPWIGGPKPNGSSGMLVPQIVLGGRIPWPLSFGLQIQGGYDGSTEGTKAIAAENIGFYVRGHVQKHRRRLGFDVWGGVGIQPLAMQIGVLEPEALNLSMIDPASLDAAGLLELQRLLATQMAGVDRVHTIQSVNVPLELGATFFITEGFGINLAMALTFWLPQQECLHDEADKLCVDSGLDSQTSLFIGGGLAFLP